MFLTIGDKIKPEEELGDSVERNIVGSATYHSICETREALHFQHPTATLLSLTRKRTASAGTLYWLKSGYSDIPLGVTRFPVLP
jgi:hypothetical protein